MGCDIHTVVERRWRDKWVCIGIDEGRDRCYARFAKMAGVRGDGPDPRGIPADASDTTQLLVEQWGNDAHSHGWLPIKDAVAIYLETTQVPTSYMLEYPAEHFFSVDEVFDGTSIDDYRLVFWFDN